MYWNKAAEKLYNLEPADVIGRLLNEAIAINGSKLMMNARRMNR